MAQIGRSVGTEMHASMYVLVECVYVHNVHVCMCFVFVYFYLYHIRTLMWGTTKTEQQSDCSQALTGTRGFP